MASCATLSSFHFFSPSLGGWFFLLIRECFSWTKSQTRKLSIFLMNCFNFTAWRRVFMLRALRVTISPPSNEIISFWFRSRSLYCVSFDKQFVSKLWSRRVWSSFMEPAKHVQSISNSATFKNKKKWKKVGETTTTISAVKLSILIKFYGSILESLRLVLHQQLSALGLSFDVTLRLETQFWVNWGLTELTARMGQGFGRKSFCVVKGKSIVSAISGQNGEKLWHLKPIDHA